VIKIKNTPAETVFILFFFSFAISSHLRGSDRPLIAVCPAGELPDFISSGYHRWNAVISSAAQAIGLVGSATVVLSFDGISSSALESRASTKEAAAMSFQFRQVENLKSQLVPRGFSLRKTERID
jgi:hypothetical protein